MVDGMIGSFLYRKANNKYIIWLESKNQWIQFEEPAFEVFRAVRAGESRPQIISDIAGMYTLDTAEAEAFVNDIARIVSELPDYVKPQTDTPVPANSPDIPSPEFFSHHVYLIHSEFYRISYGSALLEYMIHPSFFHLESEEQEDVHHQIEIFPLKKELILRTGNLAWRETDGNRLKRRLFIELSGLIYNLDHTGWLAIMHASSVSRNNVSVVFMSESGSGKSTLAAMMQYEGFHLDADDYVAVDALSLKALPFPAALSVKDGALDVLSSLFPSLKTAKTYHFKNTRKTLRYLPIQSDPDSYTPKTIAAVVFVRYNPEKEMDFTEIPVTEALIRFNNDAWLTDRAEHAGKFIDWFAGLKFYVLEYSDNRRAIKQVSALFKS